jgi:hypothetical protein
MMSMRMTLRQVLVCTACDRPSDDHLPHCPTGAIDEALAKEFRWACPKCGGTAAVDLDDTIQCRECRARFSRLVGRVANQDDPEKTFIRQVNPEPEEEYVEVLVLADEGTGRFKIDQILSSLREQQKIWRARLRAARAEARRPKRRHARAAPCQICGPLFCRYAP